MADVFSGLANLVGGNLTDGVAKIISLFKVDPNQAAQHAADLEKIQADIQEKILDGVTQMSVAQSQTNTVEAGSKSVFIAGWRPFCGWVCGSALAWQFIICPLLGFTLAACGHPVALPQLDTGSLMTVLFGMLGLGGMRTYEKYAGVDTKSIGGDEA